MPFLPFPIGSYPAANCHNYLANRKCQEAIVLHEVAESPAQNNHGLPQACLVSPTLRQHFLLHTTLLLSLFLHFLSMNFPKFPWIAVLLLLVLTKNLYTRSYIDIS